MPKTTASWNGHIIAESENTIQFDNNTYFPPDALHQQFFKKSAHTSVCSWKGTANYRDVVVDGKTNANAMWVYNDPSSSAAQIKGYVAFWKGVVISS